MTLTIDKAPAMPAVIRRLVAADAQDYRTIRLAALARDPDAFGSVYDIEVARPLSAFAERLASSTVFGAFLGERIVGMAGFKTESGPKDCHKAFVWGLYVRPSARGQGVAAALMAALIAEARLSVEQLTLAVVEGNAAAIALYRRFGFAAYGVEPRALKTETGYRNEVLMARVL
ncbi:GNAT family N-acetyltransferase [Bradyrhizobium sp. U87765 SZCCT0131]|uniref:GNAT family N-acetyltransferase n=1 Tax=unclassified Bradyrhizobium TaxID=2631580 RepID=UPI001BAE4C39|nr:MULTISPECIES: GNAT family N-acetyltransferase [unclassified Bradyrhizobium]MBR1219298.1 GNAT family N-acetyltransferase [Bradyrhizobium sp. U87765 SZCCT0131]MBR1261949.1 GNAT family N-acetyltransferase [Bradyrhizobium sp. U87765 SZCCT0134]MBR1306198.1 GNAT family N-acetyltransferase [Bradyrhizobium sp. U87765 SZCCT0110]MBR1317731.1 GNAT family N-acetyltransferase [Bradyrhizobium sp. U87765 SZCCT0109]MBR1351433.1 GNAT family N-acetyltransferase [Bradyrhizobium sp. U87765 SZCCT0048]